MQNNQNSQKIRGGRHQEIIMVDNEFISLKVDVGVLKEQVRTLTVLCDKMDKVIERLMDNQEKIVNDIYEDMTRETQNTDSDIKELHSRITTVDRNLSDKIESTEHKIMEEIRLLRNDINNQKKSDNEQITKLLEWKWMIIGGILSIGWLLSYIKFDTIEKIFR
jgi:hypothetical protein